MKKSKQYLENSKYMINYREILDSLFKVITTIYS